jgi:hypothetical protein
MSAIGAVLHPATHINRRGTVHLIVDALARKARNAESGYNTFAPTGKGHLQDGQMSWPIEG